jgi:hypothetical protein
MPSRDSLGPKRALALPGLVGIGAGQDQEIAVRAENTPCGHDLGAVPHDLQAAF